VSAGFSAPNLALDTLTIDVEVSDGERSIDYRPRLPSTSAPDADGPTIDLSICVRLVLVAADRFELQATAWQGDRIAAIDRIGLDMRPERLRVLVDGTVEHLDAWRPEPPMLEHPGDAYARIEDAAKPLAQEEEWRERGRRVIVERSGDDRERIRAAAESRDHFIVQRLDRSAPDVPTLEEEWRDEQLHGIVTDLESAIETEALPRLLWADFRGALIYLEPDSWAALESALRDLPVVRAPFLAVDPLLSGRAQAQAEVEVPEDILSAALDELPNLHLVLAEATARDAAFLSARHPNRLLIGHSGERWREIHGGRLADEATENLRYLTELVTLGWFRAVSARSGGELGRYGRLPAGR
jgi:hypothetical protein